MTIKHDEHGDIVLEEDCSGCAHYKAEVQRLKATIQAIALVNPGGFWQLDRAIEEAQRAQTS